MSEQLPSFQASDVPETTTKRRLKTLADLLPAIGFFGVFFFFGRDMIFATTGLLVGLLVQLVIYKSIRQVIPIWMKILLGIAFVFATMTLVFRDPDFIKIRSTISGFLVGCVFLGSVLIKKNILELILGKMLIYPTRTWNVMTILWSIPIFLNAGLNLFLANLLPWFDFGFSDDLWMSYRFVGSWVVMGTSFGLVIGYLAVTKQSPGKPHSDEVSEDA